MAFPRFRRAMENSPTSKIASGNPRNAFWLRLPNGALTDSGAQFDRQRQGPERDRIASDRPTGQPNHPGELEAEVIHILGEVAAEFDNPVLLYPIENDSSVNDRRVGGRS